MARYIQSPEMEKIFNLGHSTQQDYHLEQKEREIISQTSKNKAAALSLSYRKGNTERSSLNRKESIIEKKKSQMENKSPKPD